MNLLDQLVTVMCNPILKDLAPYENGLMLIYFLLKLKDDHSSKFWIYLIGIDMEATCSEYY